MLDDKNYEFNSNSPYGVYIIHGFTGSTFEVRDLAEYLSKQGFYTRADNLPGHGTTPEDCNRFKYSDWIKFVEQNFAEMVSKCTHVYVIGVSMGSILALYLSTVFPVNAAVYASIAIKFQDKIGARILTPIFHRIIPFRPKIYSYPKHMRQDMKFNGYDVWPMSALNEMRKLTNYISPLLNNVKCPSMLMQSNLDKLTLKENIEYVYDNISSKEKEKIFFDKSNHNIFSKSSDQKLIFEMINSFFNKYNI